MGITYCIQHQERWSCDASTDMEDLSTNCTGSISKVKFLKECKWINQMEGRANNQYSQQQTEETCEQQYKEEGHDQHPNRSNTAQGTPQQYSQPAEKMILCTASDHSKTTEGNDGDKTSQSGIDSEFEWTKENFEDKMDKFVCAYHTFRGAKWSFANKNILNTMTVHAHLEYKDHFAGIAQGKNKNYIICNNGADTWVISEGWNIIDRDPIHCANLIAFDPNKLCKLGCLIITGSTTIMNQNGQLTRIIVWDAMYNQGSPFHYVWNFKHEKQFLLIPYQRDIDEWMENLVHRPSTWMMMETQ